MDLRRHRLDTQPNPPVVEECDDDNPAATEDVEAFYVIRAIARQVVNCQRVQLRNNWVLLDGYEGKPIAQLNLHHVPHQVVFFPDGEARCVELSSVNDLYDQTELIRGSLQWYEREFPSRPHTPEKEVLA